MSKNQNEVLEDQNKKEQIKKPKEPPKTITKQYYTIKMEVTAPVDLEYKILAESPEQALELALKASTWNNLLAGPPKPNLSKIKRIKAKIYLAGTSLIKLTKIF